MSRYQARPVPVLISLVLAFVLTSGLVACARSGKAPDAAQERVSPAGIDARTVRKWRVVATTSIVADVVRQIGGDRIELSVLLPVGADEHGFELSPQDVAKVADADLVFANGAGLEEFLQPLLENAGGDVRVVLVSDGIELIENEGGHDTEGDEHSADPHTWTDPNNVISWTQNIEEAFKQLDPENAGAYAQNAERYRQELLDLDTWIREQVERIPTGGRRLVVDHLVFAYFAQEYGFEQVGAIIPSFSTLAEPSAQEIARLEDTIREQGVKAIFVGTTVNPSLAERIAADTGTRLIKIYTGSLSEEGGEADSYIDYMRYNVNAIVEALRS